MLFAAVLVDALHAPLEDPEVAFNRIRGHVAPCVFLFRVIDPFMGGKLFARLSVVVRLVGLQPAIERNVLKLLLANSCSTEIVNLD